MARDSRWAEDHVDHARCREIAAFLRTSTGVIAGYLESDPWWSGLRGSRFEAEIAESRTESDKGFEIGLRASTTLMNVSLFAVAQHLKSIATLLECGDPPADSIGVLARSVIEISARAGWLAEKDISWRQRMARAYVEKLWSAKEVSNFEQAAKLEPGKLGAPPTLTELETEMSTLGLTFKSGGYTGEVADQKRPSATKLLTELLQEDMPGSNANAFKLLSALSHGTLWGLMIHFESTREPEEMQRRSATYKITQNWLDGPSCTSSLALGWTVERICDLLGWDRGPIESFMTRCDDLFGALPEDEE